MAEWSAVERWGLLVFLLFTLVALAGFGVFGIRPERLPDSQAVISFWAISGQFFAQLHILLAAVVLFAVLVKRAGRAWVVAGVTVYLVSMLSEFVGTGYGIPFGEYSYTTLLGAKLGGRVPFVIPLSWFLMALPAFGLAAVTFPAPGSAWSRIGFSTLLLVVWDLALDPAMSYSPPLYWSWGASGPYYGMPWVNLVGWFGTGAVIMFALDRLAVWRWVRGIPPSWLLGYYGVTLLMPFGMIVLEGLWLAVAVTAAGLAVSYGIHRGATRATREGGGALQTSDSDGLLSAAVEGS